MLFQNLLGGGSGSGNSQSQTSSQGFVFIPQVQQQLQPQQVVQLIQPSQGPQIYQVLKQSDTMKPMIMVKQPHGQSASSMIKPYPQALQPSLQPSYVISPSSSDFLQPSYVLKPASQDQLSYLKRALTQYEYNARKTNKTLVKTKTGNLKKGLKCTCQ